MASATQIRIDVWSDYVCPFCYLQLPEIRKVQESLGSALKVTWRAFELRPDPTPTLDPGGEYLRNTWQRSVYPLARERRMTLKLPPVQPRSRKAMEAAMFAQAQDRFDAMHEAIFSAFFEHGRDIGDVEVLVDLGESVGLLKDDLRRALYDQRYTAEVEEDEQLAYAFGISGVPMMLLRPPVADDDNWQQAVPLQGAVPYAAIEAAARRLLNG